MANTGPVEIYSQESGGGGGGGIMGGITGQKIIKGNIRGKEYFRKTDLTAFFAEDRLG